MAAGPVKSTVTFSVTRIRSGVTLSTARSVAPVKGGVENSEESRVEHDPPEDGILNHAGVVLQPDEFRRATHGPHGEANEQGCYEGAQNKDGQA